jgi:hypothetical protein
MLTGFKRRLVERGGRGGGVGGGGWLVDEEQLLCNGGDRRCNEHISTNADEIQMMLSIVESL